MRRRSLEKTVARLLVGLFLVGPWASGTALCVGADGHFGLTASACEGRSDGDCHRLSTCGGVPAKSLPAFAQSRHVACVDIPLHIEGRGFAHVQTCQPKVPVAGKVLPAVEPSPRAPRRTCLSLEAEPPPQPRSGLDPCRTVVLLI